MFQKGTKDCTTMLFFLKNIIKQKYLIYFPLSRKNRRTPKLSVKVLHPKPNRIVVVSFVVGNDGI